MRNLDPELTKMSGETEPGEEPPAPVVDATPARKPEAADPGGLLPPAGGGMMAVIDERGQMIPVVTHVDLLRALKNVWKGELT
ncbi:MAG TPA: hypothetical protein VNN77_13595 [candidate division Zixibacteria bacterium]|nr:hypothetical protein [candidate division Zixibacteria bacterium]